jgi:uncharacterized protein (TIGR02646 family)
MRKFERMPAPAFLLPHWEQWGIEWERRRNANSGAAFHWHRITGEPVNQKLLPQLKAQVQDHCSFCDNYPISPPSSDTIEHFRPKTKFPREAYQWENLYYCCNYCQQKKGEAFDDLLLRPDAPDYSFEQFFRWDYTRGTLEVNEQAPEQDQHRARVTIETYGLNDGHPLLRRRELSRRSRDPQAHLDGFAYRGFIEHGGG